MSFSRVFGRYLVLNLLLCLPQSTLTINPTELHHAESALIEMVVQVDGEKTSPESRKTVRLHLYRKWAPTGYNRLMELIKVGWFTDLRFFRTIKDFMVQFGMSGSPHNDPVDWATKYVDTSIPGEDPVKKGNKKGYLTFAMSQGKSRSTQVFINYKDNSFLDPQGFAPVGKVVDDNVDMSILESFYHGYSSGSGGERNGPDQGSIKRSGNVYLDEKFPKLAKLVGIQVVEEPIGTVNSEYIDDPTKFKPIKPSRYGGRTVLNSGNFPPKEDPSTSGLFAYSIWRLLAMTFAGITLLAVVWLYRGKAIMGFVRKCLSRLAVGGYGNGSGSGRSRVDSNTTSEKEDGSQDAELYGHGDTYGRE